MKTSRIGFPAALLALAAALTAALPAHAQDKPVNLKMSSWVPAQHPLNPSLQAWADDIKKTKVGGTTGARQTPRGIEFIGICSSREVSDDRVAKMVFQSEGTEDEQGEALSKKYIAELRKRARIVQR